MNANPQIEIEAAEALLDIGVSLPFFKIPFTRKVVRLTMRRPCLGGQIRLARLYLQTGVTYERMLEFTKHEELAYMALHGRRVSKMVALTICRGAFSTWLFSHGCYAGSSMTSICWPRTCSSCACWGRSLL